MTLKPKRTVYETRGVDTSRIKALSDGLFAIVLTLLVLQLLPPERTASSPSPGTLAYLADLWPKLFSFNLTFVVGGLFWGIHHWDFEHITGYTRPVLWINLMFLLPVSLLPFTTALIGSDLNTFTWNLYCVNMILIGLTLTALWGYALSAGLVDPDMDGRLARSMLGSHLSTPLIFLLSMLVAYLSLGVAMYVPILAIPARTLGRRLFLGRRVATDVSPEAEEVSNWRVWFWRGLGFAPLIAFAAWSGWLVITHRL